MRGRGGKEREDGKRRADQRLRTREKRYNGRRKDKCNTWEDREGKMKWKNGYANQRRKQVREKVIIHSGSWKGWKAREEGTQWWQSAKEYRGKD